jgi:Circadian oscillating protein COP23
MKSPVLMSISALSLLASSMMWGTIAPAQSAEVKDAAKFMCGTSKGHPTTMAMTRRGPVPVIRWTSNYFGSGGYTPQNRCNIVSSKFQQYYKEGTLNYLTTGTANKMPVVCVAKIKGGPCDGVLFTLKPGSDPWKTLTRLMNVRAQATPVVLNESASSAPPAANIVEDKYVNMNAFLDAAPVETLATPTTPKNYMSQPDSQPRRGLW